jgi:uncharacterized membrane protein YeaQ/YmgE (transglycosylase-associated protein family)
VLLPPPKVALVAGELPSKARVADHSYVGAAPEGMGWFCSAAVTTMVGISASAVMEKRGPAGWLEMTRGMVGADWVSHSLSTTQHVDAPSSRARRSA